jgi:hypothetical protein
VQWRPGTTQTITWNSTAASPYNITLWQQFPPSRGIGAINLGSIYGMQEKAVSALLRSC